MFYILPWILGGAANAVDKQGNDTLTLVLSLIGLLLMLWGIVVLGFLHGTRGTELFWPRSAAALGRARRSAARELAYFAAAMRGHSSICRRAIRR